MNLQNNDYQFICFQAFRTHFSVTKFSTWNKIALFALYFVEEDSGCIPIIQLGKEYTRPSFLFSQELPRFGMKVFSGGICKTVTNTKAREK